MKFIAFTAPILALALVACGDTPGEPKTMEEVADEAADMEQPLAGEYTSKTTLVSLEIPGAPAALADQMKGMMGDQFVNETTSCLTEAEAAKGFEERYRDVGENMNGMKCDFEEFDVDGNDVDAKLVCSGEGNLTATLTMDGDMRAETQDIDMTMAMTSPQLPGGEMNVALNVESKRVGDCS